MSFKGVHFKCDPSLNDFLTAELSMFNYNSFEERQTGFSAYCEEDNFNQSILNSLIKKYQQLGTIPIQLKPLHVLIGIQIGKRIMIPLLSLIKL